MSNQKYSSEVAPVIPCEKSRAQLQDRTGMAREKKEIFKPQIFRQASQMGRIEY
jgi:hypothetical protein